MEGVGTIACDMDPDDYIETFKDSCPHIQTVFDHFYIVKNFKDKVLSDGNPDAANVLKNNRYILISSQDTLMCRPIGSIVQSDR